MPSAVHSLCAVVCLLQTVGFTGAYVTSDEYKKSKAISLLKNGVEDKSSAETEIESREEAIRILENFAKSRRKLNDIKKIVYDIETDLKQRHESNNDLQRKRKGMSVIKKILDEMESDLIYEQKRACVVSLGGHCATESAAMVADQWHYLNSPLSPGRKRRDTSLYRKLIQGQIV